MGHWRDTFKNEMATNHRTSRRFCVVFLDD
jgi:hypothetical protein